MLTSIGSRALLVLALFFTSGAARAGVSVLAFGPSAYSPNTSAMNALMGIDSSYSVEDFEDATLVAGLSYRIDAGPVHTSLPNLYSRLTNGYTWLGNTYPGQYWLNDPWDGDHMLINSPQNDNTGPTYGSVTFLVAGGTNSFGVGVSNFQSGYGRMTIEVNGVSIGELGQYTSSLGLGRNAYLLIGVAAGDAPITSVRFLAGDAGEDSRTFDHVAFRRAAAVPEPGTLGLAAAAVGLSFAASRRRRGA